MDYDAADEPRLALPLPPGWRLDSAPMSPIVRAVSTGPGREDNRYQPKAVLTLENNSELVDTPEEAIDAQIVGVSRIAVVVDDIRGTTCGYSSAIVTYDTGVDNHGATCLIVAGWGSRNTLWSATLTVQGFDPHNPDYVSEKDSILSGFQFAFTGD
ncbi:hypothetical protein BST33_08625 [Mycolicibacter minnesotensis]|uniref:Uncharacterized protein n=1 Tax=Mycolicibacter minnesotensis TaxID=1118379 RepID=A0AA91M6M0_9MYCO|nr:hypothetical protein BST33_08625 [Mycolicibacter minnesotensis]